MEQESGSKKAEYRVFKQHMYGGPKGLGDPTYRELSKMEEDPMIPQRMRDITRTQLCIPEVRAFSECSKNSGFSMVFQCQAVWSTRCGHYGAPHSRFFLCMEPLILMP